MYIRVYKKTDIHNLSVTVHYFTCSWIWNWMFFFVGLVDGMTSEVGLSPLLRWKPLRGPALFLYAGSTSAQCPSISIFPRSRSAMGWVLLIIYINLRSSWLKFSQLFLKDIFREIFLFLLWSINWFVIDWLFDKLL